MQYVHINRAEKANELILHEKKAYDVISCQSMSYRTKAVSLPTRVSEDSVDIPPAPSISKTRLAKKVRLPDGDKPHEQAAPIDTAPQTADQRDSELGKEDMACALWEATRSRPLSATVRGSQPMRDLRRVKATATQLLRSLHVTSAKDDKIISARIGVRVIGSVTELMSHP